MAQRGSEQEGVMGGAGVLRPSGAAPARAGVSIQARFFPQVLSGAAQAPFWFEVHPEDFMIGAAAEDARERLDQLRAQYPLSLHGVGLGVGAEKDLDPARLGELKALIERYDPCLYSEHLAWATHGVPENLDQLPPPYDEATLDRVSRHVEQAQQTLGVQMLLENPFSYIRLTNSTLEETEFLAAVVDRTGCGLLLDVNHAFISAASNRASTEEYLDAFPLAAIREIHLGGHSEALDAEGRPVLGHSHDTETPEEIWSLYERLIGDIGPRPTLIEWDGDTPDWARLEAEAARANAILDRNAIPDKNAVLDTPASPRRG